MNDFKILKELAAVRDAALDDLAATTDADLRKEALEDGTDIKALADSLRASMRESAAAALRSRMSNSKIQSREITSVLQPSLFRPAVERIKELIRELTQRDPRIGFAFRDGKSQTDEDWQTAYDDLVSMGLINPENDDR